MWRSGLSKSSEPADVLHVARPPERPLLIFDGDCGFCRFWVQRWQQLTGERVEYVPSQDPTVKLRFPEVPPSHFETAVQLIEPTGLVYSGAEAAFRGLANNPALEWPLRIYRTVPVAAALSEVCYGFVARHRMLFSMLTRFLWGRDPARASYSLVQRLFLAGLGLIYLVAFVSLWTQVQGLIGSRGILPANDFMAGARQFFAEQHLPGSRYHLLPTWCWVNSSDSFLQALCATGALLSLLLTAEIAPALCAALLWSLYLSLSVVGQDFLSFQWDTLLLETGFLAIFFAPLQWLPSRSREPPVSHAALWLLRWLLFRLMFGSGCVKLLSGDPTWRSLAALRFHYETQPLPTWIGWYAFQAPPAFQQACVAVMFGIELVLPFFIFGPRRLRVVACSGFVILQLWILLTGNYGFFNYLTLLLCLLLVEDAMLARVFSKRKSLRAPASPPTPTGASAPPVLALGARPSEPSGQGRRPAWPAWVPACLTAAILVANAGQWSRIFGSDIWIWQPARAWAGWLAPFRSVNTYGLFAAMTTIRLEIVVEGSNDCRTSLARFPLPSEL
jgi:lipase maturation factor 1